jgi:hypothetical protein
LSFALTDKIQAEFTVFKGKLDTPDWQITLDHDVNDKKLSSVLILWGPLSPPGGTSRSWYTTNTEGVSA